MEPNWEAIGAVGEIIGAVAVLVTLVYVAIQLRLNTQQQSENAKALRRNEMNSAMQNWSDLRRTEMSDPLLAEIIVKAQENFDALSKAELIRYNARLTEIVWINYHLWERARDGIVEPEAWSRARQIVHAVIESPGGERLWGRIKLIYDPQFVDEIDSSSTRNVGDA